MTATTCITYTTQRHTDATITRLGRRFGSDLQLDDQSVSARHALLLITPTGVVLLDDRGGGTFVNGDRVERAQLEPGDEIRLGDVSFTYLDCPPPHVGSGLGPDTGSFDSRR
jgi:pSer/pThr/pTyr-binding forkhead associated (FHA) protein